MTIILFLIVLAVLILVHEFGHFIVAKWSGMRVDEFGLGFPPRAAEFTPEGSETTYTLNWLPLGGFVKIFGEDAAFSEEAKEEMEESEQADLGRSFMAQPKWQQVLVLLAGVTMNFILAWLLFSASFMIGTPALSAPDGAELTDHRIIVTQVLPDSPAEEAELVPGAAIVSLRAPGEPELRGEEITLDAIQQYIASTEGDEELQLEVALGENVSVVSIDPESGVVGEAPAIGITMASVGTLSLPPGSALLAGFENTVNVTEQVTVGIYTLIRDAFTGAGDQLSQVAGPVGIAGLVGQAADVGIANLLSFVALISVNLAILNLVPFPALDGGRILFVIIEKIKGSPIKPQIATTANAIGFILLIVLMIVVTYQDIIRLL